MGENTVTRALGEAKSVVQRRPHAVRSLAAGAAILAGAALLAGCGGHKAATTTTTTSTASAPAPAPVHVVHVNKASYDATMKRLGGSLSKALSHIYPLVDGGPGSAENKAAAERVKTTRAVVVHVATTLSGIEPPQPVQADHKRLIAGLGHLESQLDLLIGFLEKGGPKPVGIYTEFTALNTIAKAAGDMEKKGYSVGG